MRNILAGTMLASLLLLSAETARAQEGAARPQAPSAAARVDPETAISLPAVDRNKLGYSIGVDIGRKMMESGLPVAGDAVARGLKDAITSAPLEMTDADMRGQIQAFQLEMRAKAQKEMEQKRQEWIERGKQQHVEGAAFLEKNAKKDGVTVLPSGLQYEILRAGDGPKPTAKDTVKAHYRGTFVNGEQFDNSYERGEPLEFQVGGGVIQGWTEALQLMPVGSKWRLTIPSELAYGPQGKGIVPPNAVLVFEVELLEIVKK